MIDIIFFAFKRALLEQLNHYVRSWVAQSVTCLTAVQAIMISIPAWSYTFVEIDHEINFMAFFHPSADWKRVFVSYKWKYLQKKMVNCQLVKLAQEKSVVRWTDHPNMTIAVEWDVKH